MKNIQVLNQPPLPEAKLEKIDKTMLIISKTEVTPPPAPKEEKH
jgi:hypothetical protein